MNDTGKPVPQEYWKCWKTDIKRALEIIGGRGHQAKKIDGIWTIVEKGEACENPNPADQYNTVLKMAKKRAYVDATLSATAASDIFTQDIEEIQDNLKALNEREPVSDQSVTPEPDNDTGASSKRLNEPSTIDQLKIRCEECNISWPEYKSKICRKFNLSNYENFNEMVDTHFDECNDMINEVAASKNTKTTTGQEIPKYMHGNDGH